MIIFYNKDTGKIVGTVEGRIHREEHLQMWIGDKATTERLIVGWKPFKFYDKKGKEVAKNAVDKKGQSVVYAADFEPDHAQRDLFFELDKKPILVHEYQVDVKTKQLVKKH